MTYARVYSERLSGPKVIEMPGGSTTHAVVPAGHRYVLKRLHWTNFSAGGLGTAYLVLKTTSGSINNVVIAQVGPLSTLVQDVFVVARAGEELWSYVTTGAVSMVLTTGGYDLVEQG